MALLVATNSKLSAINSTFPDIKQWEITKLLNEIWNAAALEFILKLVQFVDGWPDFPRHWIISHFCSELTQLYLIAAY